MKLKLDIDALADKTPGEIKNCIKGLDKCRLGDLKVLDLLVSPDGTQGMRHGIYAFFDDDDKCLYVGKCSSAHFAQRLGEHFWMSPKGRSSDFLPKVVEKFCGKKQPEYKDFVTTVNKIGGHRYLMILVGLNSKLYVSGDAEHKKKHNCKHKTKVIGELELIFMAILEPEFNAEFNAKGKKRAKNFRENIFPKSPNKTLRNWIKELVPAPQQ